MTKILSLAGLLVLMAGSAFSQVAKLPDTGVDAKAPVAKTSTVTTELPGTRAKSEGPKALTQVKGPGTMTSVVLDDSFEVFSLAKVGPDGKLVFECVTGKDAATKQVNLPAKKKEALDEK